MCGIKTTVLSMNIECLQKMQTRENVLNSFILLPLLYSRPMKYSNWFQNQMPNLPKFKCSLFLGPLVYVPSTYITQADINLIQVIITSFWF